MNNQRKLSLIGRRTRTDILKGKTVRKDEEGKDIFEDYWTDSDSESITFSQSHLSDVSGYSTRSSVNKLHNKENGYKKSQTRQGLSLSKDISKILTFKSKMLKPNDKNLTPNSASNSYEILNKTKKNSLKIGVNVSSQTVEEVHAKSPKLRSATKKKHNILKDISLISSKNTVLDDLQSLKDSNSSNVVLHASPVLKSASTSQRKSVQKKSVANNLKRDSTKSLDQTEPLDVSRSTPDVEVPVSFSISAHKSKTLLSTTDFVTKNLDEDFKSLQNLSVLHASPVLKSASTSQRKSVQKKGVANNLKHDSAKSLNQTEITNVSRSTPDVEISVSPVNLRKSKTLLSAKASATKILDKDLEPFQNMSALHASPVLESASTSQKKSVRKKGVDNNLKHDSSKSLKQKKKLNVSRSTSDAGISVSASINARKSKTLLSARTSNNEILDKDLETLQNLSSNSLEHSEIEDLLPESESPSPNEIQVPENYHIKMRKSKEMDKIILDYDELDEVIKLMSEGNGGSGENPKANSNVGENSRNKTHLSSDSRCSHMKDIPPDKELTVNCSDRSERSKTDRHILSEGKPSVHKKKRKLPKYSEKNLNNDDNDEYILKKKLRSSSERYPPLAHWRNERLLYRFEKGQINILGVAEGTAEAFKSKYKHQSRKRHKHQKNKKNKLHDNLYDRDISVELAKSFTSVAWDENSSENPVRIKNMFNTINSHFGYIEIDGLETKQTQFMPEEDIHMTVLQGSVEVMIQENKIMAKSKDMFVVPRSTSYSIRNLQKRKALLSFALGKFKFLESHIK